MPVMLLGSVQTFGQYIFTYIGIGFTSGANTSVITACATFFTVLDAEATAAKLEGVSLTIATKVSSTGTIFGSVGNIQIAEALAKLGHEVDRKIIVVKDAVKEVGNYKAVVKLHKEVSVEIPFEVVAE